MGSILDDIRVAVCNGSYLVSWRADERYEERLITAWQVVAGLDEGEVLEERPDAKPNATVVVRQILADGTSIEAVWAWLSRSRRAKLVTVYFLDAE